MDKLVIASHNNGKVQEISQLLAPFAIEVISAASLDLEEPEETGTRFIANAQLKALATSKASGLAALADDSGLCVDCLDGQPGIYSARWAGPLKDFDLAMGLLYDKMLQIHRKQPYGISPFNHGASMVCALSLVVPDDHKPDGFKIHNFEGIIEGDIVWPPRGQFGFGYDAIFQPKGYDISFGQMIGEKKHAISHRAIAFKQLLDAKLFD